MSIFTKPGLSHSPSIGGVGMCIDQVDAGAILIGNGVDFDLNTLTAGAGLSIVNSPGGITLSASGTYVLPIASASVLGGIKVGANLAIDGSGVLSGTYSYTLPVASSSVLGGIKVGSGLIIDAITGSLSLDLPPDIAYTDHINTFIKDQYIDFADDFRPAGLSINVTGNLTEGLSVYSASSSAISAISRSGSGIPTVDIASNFVAARFVQGYDSRDAVGSPCTVPAIEILREGATDGINIFSGPLIYGDDHPVGTQVSTGPLLQLQKFTVDKFVIDNTGNIKVVSGVTPGNGQLLIGNGSGMSVSTLTAGSNVSITNGAGSITISAASPGITGETVKHNGTTVGIRPNINFIDGSNVTLTVADNSGTGAVDVTIASTAGGGNEAIQHNGTLIGTRPTINLIDGSNVTLTVADNSGSNRVDVTVASTGGGGGGLPADVVYTDHFNTFTVEPQTIVVGSNTLSLSSTSVDVSNGGLLSGTLTQGQLLLSKDSSTYASIHMASLISSSVYSVQGEIHTSDVAWNSNGDIPNTGFNIVQNAGLTNGGFGLYYTYSRDGFPVTKIALVTDGSIHFQVGPAGNYPSLISWQDAMVINNSGHITRINNAVPSNGQLLIGTGSGMSLSTLTAGSNVTITNGSGTITIASTGGGGTDVLADGKAFAEHSNTSPSIYDDEFNDASGMSGPVNGLDARWLKHNLGTSTWLKLDDTIAPGCLAFQIPSGQTMDQAIYQNVPAGDFTLQALFDPADISNRQMWFLFIVDTSGNGIGVGWDKDNPQVALRVMSAWQQTGSVQSLTLTADYRPAQFWLKKVGNVYTASVSESRRLRSRPTQNSFTTAAQAFTAAYMGFGRIFDTGGNSTVLLEAFRLT